MNPLNQQPIRVLLVEPDSPDRPGLHASLEGDGSHGPPLELESAGELAEALERLSRGGIDVVLLDLKLPDSEGIVTFERMYAFAPDVPIVVVADSDDDRLAMATVQGGAQDHLVRNHVEPALVARSLRYAIERHRLLSALRSLSLIDDLTGLYNRRGFLDLGDQYLKLARRSARGVALVYVDLDRFKTINDTLGHHVGDRALIKMADLLKASFRRSDILARIGGDEFAVLAIEASGEDVTLLVERLRERVADFNSGSRESYQLSVSVGAARFDTDGRVRLEELLSQADEAMYEEKRRKKVLAR